ncbi:ATP-binding protein [Actinocorallia sp. A-T 12471]|uniref:ATP-binding protein n=1 Tax=Actinocorallia sp. A-T 12471 TaxID=3089813 RepID=UPI0029CBF2E6|nr:ATP-binding protein [Actinocorallia sp. A-T 12471]MDX6744593.1 ATP-binding protein [Actinocorallia sp. A-T 12471]
MVASKACAGLAWSLVEQRLIGWSIGAELRYDVHLVLSELVANAVAVTPVGGTVNVRCDLEGGAVLLGVADTHPGMPSEPAPVVPLEPGDLDLREENFDVNGGWGLTIVKALSEACGVAPLPGGGKVIWARLRP